MVFVDCFSVATGHLPGQALQGSRHLGYFYRYLWVGHVDTKTRIARICMAGTDVNRCVGTCVSPRTCALGKEFDFYITPGG